MTSHTALPRLLSRFCMWRHGLKPEGNIGVVLLGHRGFVGGRWDEIGRLQFRFLVEQGLKPSHCFLDIGCGSLRGGIHFINYLERGNYLGMDKEARLIALGVQKELGSAVYEDKKPQFVVSTQFEFEKFSKQPQFSLAQSLFTHLNLDDVRVCLQNLRAFVFTGHTFFATFLEGMPQDNPGKSHSQRTFAYSRAQMEVLGNNTGWKATYIGDWGHPRNQMMMKYETI